MAKKTLKSILECPTDFLYLWASDDFIAQLGNKARIIREKKYHQYQTLWKTMAENTPSNNAQELQDVYNQWVKQIASAIEDLYGMTPATILHQLALGETVVGKNWKEGVYGIGEVRSTFAQDSNVTVSPTTGKILVNGVEAPGQTPIYGSGGVITGYSYFDQATTRQFQSGVNSNGQYGAVCYTSVNGVESASGGNFDPTTGSFWQNTQNYLPLIQKIVDWLLSLFGVSDDRTVLTTQNTVPDQTEWIEEENGNGSLVAGGLALAGLAFITMEKPKKRNKK